MIRRTLGDVRTTISRVLQLQNNPDITSTGVDVVRDRVNEIQERLISKGKWVGLKSRYSFCTYEGCITLPRELDSILGFAVDSVPKHVMNQWYEFLDGGAGIQTPSNGWSDALDRGLVVTFNDICGSKYIRVYADAPEDAAARILIKGMDANGNRVMTYDGGVLIDGEYINLSGAHPAVSVNVFTVIDSVVKPQTNGFIRLYAYDGSAQSAIAVYHPSETNPVYRRYAVPGLQPIPYNPTPVPHTVTILAKRKFIPAVSDTDDLLITNIAALKNMAIAIEKEEVYSSTEAEVYEKRAIQNLNDELKEYQGASRAIPNIVLRGFSGGEVKLGW